MEELASPRDTHTANKDGRHSASCPCVCAEYHEPDNPEPEAATQADTS